MLYQPIRELILPEKLLRPWQAQGTHTFILFGEGIEQTLYAIFRRRGLCLKVFKEPATSLPETFYWGASPLIVSTKIQNLYAWHGLAPRVYGLVLLNQGQFAQVTEFLTGESGGSPPSQAVLEEIEDEYGLTSFHNIPFWRKRVGAWVTDGKVVDFGPVSFTDVTQYEQSLAERANKVGTRHVVAYQSVPGLSLPGRRDMEYRTAAMRLDEIDFRGKTVLDLGCNLGVFCQEARRRGARRVVGIDSEFQRAKLSYEIANWLGYWSLDFFDLRLPNKRTRIRGLSGIYVPFDVVFALAVAGHVGGYGTWMANLCGEIFYLEGHNTEDPAKYRGVLERDFGKVEFLGLTRDWRVRPLFRCWKRKKDAPT